MSLAQQRTVTAVCVDDHGSFRRVLRELIAATPGFTQVGEASCGLEAMEAVEALAPDLVLMDVRMPGSDGVETARVLLARHPDLCVVLTTAGPITAPAGLTDLGQWVPMVRKQDLCPSLLLDLWRGRRPRAAARTGSLS